MSRLRNARRPLLAGLTAVAAVGLLLSTTIGSSAAQTGPVVVYDTIPATLPANFSPSLSFEADNVNEFGDLVTLAPGPRVLTKVSVPLSSQACQDPATTGTPQCSTTPGATFPHELTLTLYNVAGTAAAPEAGTEIATATEEFAIPYRPSASPETGVAFVADFEFPAGPTLPDTLIWGIAFNTAIERLRSPKPRAGHTTP